MTWWYCFTVRRREKKKSEESRIPGFAYIKEDIDHGKRKGFITNTGMNEAKEDGNRAEKSQESEGKVLHNVNDIMDQLMAYGDAVNDAAFSELLEKLPEEDTKKTFAPGEPKNSMMARMMASSMERGDVQAYINMGKAAVANAAQAEARKAAQPAKNKPTFGEAVSAS